MSRIHFVHCHVHSHFSLMRGVDGPDTLLELAAARGYQALAITDCNNLYGAIPFVEAARKAGVRPILGSCLRDHENRCIVLVADPTGYRNLCRIITGLNLNERPALVELLKPNADGLHVLVNDLDMAINLREAFGARLWLEVVRPGRTAAREKTLLDGGRRLGLKPVASTAAHFATSAGYETFRLLTASRQRLILEQLPERLPITAAHHLADPEEVFRRFRDLPEAILNSELLAEQCRSDVLPRGRVLPPARVADGKNVVDHLREMCLRGWPRLGEADDETARRRLEEELQIIDKRDLASYFLVVHDITKTARLREFDMSLRGSAGNSLVCYLLAITNVDPLRFGLSFERFLHAGRPDLPDIDLDFDWRVRDQVIAEVIERYGQDHAAMICAHVRLQAPSAFREAAKVHGLSNEQIKGLLETMSDRLKFQNDPGAAGITIPRDFPFEPSRWPHLLADTRRLLDRPHHLSVHPGGIVITPEPIAGYVPLQRAAKVVITQFEKDAIARIGLVKIDLLGNRALSTVVEARRWAASASQPQRPISEKEPATLRLLREGDTLGVNQLESAAMRHLLIQLRPRHLEDIIQALALIRPGAASIGAKETFIRRRRGLEETPKPLPVLEPLLADTHGLMLYEDDALQVIQALTGLAAPAADRMRKEVAQRMDPGHALALADEFLTACAENGVAREAAAEFWVQLAKFNRYSFNRSHAVSYALVAWEAVGIKARQPSCFWVAALNNNQGMYPRRVYVEGAKRAGIQFRLPCVNHSYREFTLENGVIRTGLAAIRRLPEAVGQTILESRGQHGPFQNLAEFRSRVEVGPETLAILIQVGAFDCMGQERAALMLEVGLDPNGPKPASLYSRCGTVSRPCHAASLCYSHELGQHDWRPPEYSQVRKWREEWDRLGFFVGPPLMRLFRRLLPKGLHDSRTLRARIGQPVRLAGLVAASRTAPTRHGDEMRFVTLEDEWGLMEVTLFPGNNPPTGNLGMGPYLVRGTVEEQYGVLSISATGLPERINSDLDQWVSVFRPRRVGHG